jgi:multiple sugar transport system substrate-binding protein
LRIGRRSYLAGAGGALGGAALAACGASTTAPPPAAETRPVTIEYNVQSAVLWEKAGKVVPAFNERFPHITVQATPDGGIAKLRTLLAGGTPPDTTWLNISDMPGVAEQGALFALDSWITRDWKALEGDDVYPGAWEAVTWKGKRHGTPYEANPFLPVYRTDFFDAAGVPYPTKQAEGGGWDWNAVLETARKLTRTGTDGKRQFGLQLRTGNYALFHWIWNNGGEVWNADRTECLMNRPPAVEAIQFMQDLIVKHRVVPMGAETGAEVKEASGTTSNDMLSKIIAFEWQFSGGGSRMGGVVDFPFQVAPEPRGKAARVIPHMNGAGNVLLKEARNPEPAWEFLKFYASKQADVILMDTGIIPPRRRSSEEHYARNVKYPPNNKVLSEMARTARMTPSVPAWADFNTILATELAPVWVGSRRPNEALDEVVRQVNPLLKR